MQSRNIEKSKFIMNCSGIAYNSPMAKPVDIFGGFAIA